MKPVREVISREIIDDLWGAGYTILPRNRHADPFHVPPEMVPQGRSYQWMHLVEDKVWMIGQGWAAVPASRHDGYYMPAGHVGDIEVNGLGLFEKPKFEVDRDKAQQIVAAHKQVDDWKAKWGGEFSGEVSVGGEKTAIGETKTYENTTKIPRDMVPYIDKIFAERDLIAAECLDVRSNLLKFPDKFASIETAFESAISLNPDAARWPTLHAVILPIAIENIRKQLAEEPAK